jgi:hypothetical protein
MMVGMLSDWFNANLAQFTHVFSTVNLNMTADKAQFQWLLPTDVSYAYVDAPDLDTALFGVLCMTEGRSGLGLPQELSQGAVPAGQRAGFSLAAGRYLEKLLKPGLPSMFQNSTVADFIVDESANQVRNKVQLNMAAVNIGAGTYTPVVDAGNFTVTVTGDELVLNMLNVHVPFSPGIDIYLNYTYYANLVLGTNSKGEQIVMLQQSSQAPVTNHSVNVAAWVTWTTVVAGLVTAVISGFVGAGTKAVFETVAYRVIATIICLLVLGVLSSIALIMVAVATGDKDKLPPVNFLVLNATSPVTWPGGSGFTLTSAGLNGVFQLGGNPGFGQTASRAKSA